MRKLQVQQMVKHISAKEIRGEDIIHEFVMMFNSRFELNREIKRYYRHVMKPRDPYLAPYRRDNLVMFGRVARPAI
jgi:hypothetical protein